jgi:hypothetical protein
MGLNVSGISNIEQTEEEGLFYLEISSEKTKYTNIHNYDEGWYDKTNESEDHVFRAGTYGGYSQFRNLLSLSIYGCSSEYIWDNEEEFVLTPFIEIINFTDCEGYLGASVAEKLYSDFKINASKFAKYIYVNIDDIGLREDMICIYDNWIKALKVAKDNGIIIFN